MRAADLRAEAKSSSMSTGALSTPEEVKDVKVDPAAASERSLTVLRVPSLPVSEQVPTCQLDVCGLALAPA